MKINQKMYEHWLTVHEEGRAAYVTNTTARLAAIFTLILCIASYVTSNHLNLGVNLILGLFIGVSSGFGRWYQCEKRFLESERATPPASVAPRLQPRPVKVCFPKRVEDPLDGGEWVWAEPLSHQKYKLQAAPVGLEGISSGAIVEVYDLKGVPVFSKLVA